MGHQPDTRETNIVSATSPDLRSIAQAIDGLRGDVRDMREDLSDVTEKLHARALEHERTKGDLDRAQKDIQGLDAKLVSLGKELDAIKVASAVTGAKVAAIIAVASLIATGFVEALYPFIHHT